MSSDSPMVPLPLFSSRLDLPSNLIIYHHVEFTCKECLSAASMRLQAFALNCWTPPPSPPLPLVIAIVLEPSTKALLCTLESEVHTLMA